MAEARPGGLAVHMAGRDAVQGIKAMRSLTN